MTKRKITFLVVGVILAFVLTIFIFWYCQGLTPMDFASSKVKRNENMIFINSNSDKKFAKPEIYDYLFGETFDRTMPSLPKVTITEDEALKIAMDFFDKYKLSGGYPIKRKYVLDDFFLERNNGKYYGVCIEMDIPLPEYVINNNVRRKNEYLFYVNDSGVIYVSFM